MVERTYTLWCKMAKNGAHLLLEELEIVSLRKDRQLELLRKISRKEWGEARLKSLR